MKKYLFNGKFKNYSRPQVIFLQLNQPRKKRKRERERVRERKLIFNTDREYIQDTGTKL